MTKSSDGPTTNTKCYIEDTVKRIPLCKEYVFDPQDSHISKKALTLILISCSFYYAFLDNGAWERNRLFICTVFSFTVISFVNLCTTVKKETLLIAVPVTLQMTTTYLFGRESTFCVPFHALSDFMIIEVITGQQVRYFLSVALNEHSYNNLEHVILFRSSRPNLMYLESVYKDLQVIFDKSR